MQRMIKRTDFFSSQASHLMAIFILMVSFSSSAQTSQEKDTIVLMTYNLLNYGNTTTYCTSSNNNIGTKDQYLKTILNHVNPDILVVNEMGCNSVYAKRILTNCLNMGTEKYKAGALFSRISGQDICNLIFYNSELFSISDGKNIEKNSANQTMIRSAGNYELLYNSPGLAEHKDSTKFRVIATHLKAGSASADVQTRGLEASIIMEQIAKYDPAGNFVLCGDLNLYRSSETAWTNFTNHSNSDYNFFDPINKVGSWTANPGYAQYHTQSVVTNGNGCQSGGGMDDRFDFILASKDVMDGTKKVKILPSTYQALGQDGNRYNQSINNPSNNTQPAAVINSLASMSDHLPVIAKLEISYTLLDAIPESVWENNRIRHYRIANPANNLQIFDLQEPTTISIFDLDGQLVYENELMDEGPVEVPIIGGLYILKISNSNYTEVHKWIKK